VLFNSYEFLFAFLPILLAGLFLLVAFGWARAAVWWVGLGSIVFYGLGSPEFVPLLVVSTVANYAIGTRILVHNGSGDEARLAKRWLIFGIAANLAALAYFKYTNFFLNNLSALSGWQAQWPRIVLPVGISFFTFTQIAFLVDCRRGEAHRYRFWDYLLFVSFFPHLVAGPILNHKSILPQIDSRGFGRPGPQEVYAALIFFSIGLFKKTIIADSVAPMVQVVFNTPTPLFADAWAGALLYTFQLYYDFSGYSEMAVGLALLMNVRIPINFNSPYKSTSIVEFWRRWHISLSNFLRDYLYIPLGGNRLGTRRRYANLLATMVLGGLWHGAGWTFLVWGTLHGLGLAITHQSVI
jgi:alginate O-acetyltransferase complex protein AlgI